MKYKVTYFDENSQKTNKFFDLDKEEIISIFNKENLRLINIEEVSTKKNTFSIKKDKKIKARNISSLLRQLSILLASGLDFKLAINVLISQEKNKLMKETLEEVNKNLDQGFSISQSFVKTNKFPSLLSGILEAGESSSRLEESIGILADYYEEDEKTRQLLKNALYYPCILLLVTFIVTIIMIYMVLPRYVDLFAYFDGLELPALTQSLLKVSDFLLKKGWLLLIFFIIIFIALRRFTSYKFKLAWSKFRLSYPFIGSYILAYEIQRFSGIFALLIDSGIETMDAIKKSSKSINNLYLKNEFLKLNKDILEGNTLYETFSKIKVLPSMFLNLINVGEMSSNLATTMNISYNYYKNIVKEKSKKLTALFEPIIIIVVSLVVGTVVIAIALPMFSLVNIVNF